MKLVINILAFVLGVCVGYGANTEPADAVTIEEQPVVHVEQINTEPVVIDKQPLVPDAPEVELLSFDYLCEPEALSEEDSCGLSAEEIDLIALVTMAEAEGESEFGKRLVIDTILNRVDSVYFPNTVHDVIYQPNAFSSMWNGRVDRCSIQSDICALVKEELLERTDFDVVFFSAYNYSAYGTPMFQIENHYFSKY